MLNVNIRIPERINPLLCNYILNFWLLFEEKLALKYWNCINVKVFMNHICLHYISFFKKILVLEKKKLLALERERKVSFNTRYFCLNFFQLMLSVTSAFYVWFSSEVVWLSYTRWKRCLWILILTYQLFMFKLWCFVFVPVIPAIIERLGDSKQQVSWSYLQSKQNSIPYNPTYPHPGADPGFSDRGGCK